MKIQCSCGAKYAFDIAPGMQPIKFICQNCGHDYSDFVNDLIRKELAEQFPTAPMLPPTQPTVPAETEIPRLKISRAPSPAAQPENSAPESKYCPRHRDQIATEHCRVCKKPICSKCMEAFGYFCSPFCRAKAGAQDRNVPAFGGQKFAAERLFWRKTGLISGAIALAAFLALGAWFWYAWFGSVPHIYFSVRFEDKSHSGSSRLVGKDQIVFLHGGTLARYNLKTKEKVWSLGLVTKQQVADELKRQDDEATQKRQKYGRGSDTMMVGSLREKYARIDFEQELSLRGAGQNIWIAKDDTLTHYDWNTGSVLQKINLTNRFGELTERGDEILAFSRADDGAQAVTHVNMDTGDLRTEEFHSSSGAIIAQNSPLTAAPDGGGLPLSPNAEARPMNPQKVAQQAQNLTLPARIALPALLANSAYNQQINAQLDDSDQRNRNPQKVQSASPQQRELENFNLIPDGDSYVEFSSQMVEEHLVEREAMQAPPKKSALDSGNVGVMNETAAVNEQLNEIQRNNGGDKVTEDQSRYQVVIRRPDSQQADWIGEVVGPPVLIPLKAVNVLTAGKTVIVFDKSNKKIWQAEFTYNVSGGGLYQSQYGEGPCAELGDTLYVFDQAVLTAFDLATGTVRWRIPSVGVVGLFFDSEGMLYVNTTTGNPDDIKYSRQIDVTKQTEAVVLKVNPKTGAILWSAKPGGFISYLSGKFIYTVQSFDPGDEEDALNESLAGLQKPPYLRIARINPQNGRVMWDHEEDRAPVNVQFYGNTIQIVFKKEVEVLRFFTL